MTYTTTPKFGPAKTPTVIKALLWAILGGSIFFAIIQQGWGAKLSPYSPVELFGLSLWGIKKVFLWQFISYPFIVAGGLSFGLVLYLAFELYIVWVIGTQLLERIGSKPFLRLFFLSCILGGLGAIIVQWLAGMGMILTGATAVLYALLVAWMMFYHDMQMLLFMVFPLKTRWLVIGLLGINVLMDLGSGSWSTLAANLVGALTGYLYALISWNRQGPFQFARPFEDWANRLGSRVRQWWDRPRSKIYDLKTGRSKKRK